MKSARQLAAVIWLALVLAVPPFEATGQYEVSPSDNPYDDPYDEPYIEPEPTSEPIYSYQTVAWAGGDYFASSALSPTQTLDIAILGDGFTAAEQGQYRAIVESLIQGMLAQEPFKEYQRFINFHRVDVISNESGTDYGSDLRCNKLEPYSQYCFRDTALDGGFLFVDSRGMKVDSNKVATALANSLGPPNSSRYDTVVVIVNDAKYGGSDNGFAAITSKEARIVNITLHELGHRFGRLGDEYGSTAPPSPAPPPCFFDNEFREPNLTAQPVLFQPQHDPGRNYKWNYWIPLGTPIPTLGIQNPVGVWEGAVHCNQGAWRPHYESKMRSISYPYGVVNTEVLVKKIYTFAPLVAASFPAVGNVSVPRGVPQPFWVSPLASPVSHGFKVRWRVDGGLDGEGMSYTLNTDELSVGTHTVTAVIADETPSVRRDPDNLLNEELRWSVTVTAAVPAPNPLEDNTFFVKQHYRDFLNREAEQAGLDAWVRVLSQCPAGDTSCDRVEVSSSFFRSSEFMQNGYFVYRFYRVAYGRLPTFSEFMEDMQPVIPLDGQVEARRAFYADGFASRSSFAAIHGGRNNWDYVNGLMANAGGLIASRDQLVADRLRRLRRVEQPHRRLWPGLSVQASEARRNREGLYGVGRVPAQSRGRILPGGARPRRHALQPRVRAAVLPRLLATSAVSGRAAGVAELHLQHRRLQRGHPRLHLLD